MVKISKFDEVGEFSTYGFALVKADNKCNIINNECKVISDRWFDDIFSKSVNEWPVRVKLDGKYNFINENGKLLSNAMYEDAKDFDNGHAAVKEDGKWYFIGSDGLAI